MRSSFAWAARHCSLIRVGQIRRYSSLSAPKFIAAVLELNLSPECVCVIWLCSVYLGLAPFLSISERTCRKALQFPYQQTHFVQICLLWNSANLFLCELTQTQQSKLNTCEFASLELVNNAFAAQAKWAKLDLMFRAAYLVNYRTQVITIKLW